MALCRDSLPSFRWRFLLVLGITAILILSIQFSVRDDFNQGLRPLAQMQNPSAEYNNVKPTLNKSKSSSQIQAVILQGLSTPASIQVKVERNVTESRNESKNSSETCPSVLVHTLQGHWKTRPLTKKESAEMIAFLGNAQSRFRFPSNYQRTDLLCGNVTHLGSQMASQFRALCDPRGATPCCYHNQCAMKSVEECVCEDCYDMRHMKHAEYSTWIPSHPACPYKVHTPQEACDILNGMTITVVGDSLIRHIFMALLLVISGNMKDGAMKPNTDKASKGMCKELYMFTEKRCRHLLYDTLTMCKGKVRLSQFWKIHHGYGGHLKGLVAGSKPKSMIFTGIGVHSKFNYTAVQTQFLLPTLTYMQSKKSMWPKLVWVTHHAPGLLKSPKFLSQTYDKVRNYNAKMEPFLKNWKIPIFDTFNLTDGMMSFDGEHYGRGMNVVKANILLSYIRELRESQSW